MNIMDILNQSGGVGAMARELGVDESTAQAGAGALLPAVLGGMKGQAEQSPGGLGGLLGTLTGMGGGSMMDNVTAPEPTDVSQGNNVLGSIFGSKDVSRTVADHAAQQSGVSPDLLKKMLPMVAMLVAGYMTKQAGGAGGGMGGGLGGMLGSVLGGGGAGGGGGMGGALGGLGSLLGLGSGGNALQDILNMAGRR